MRDEGDLPGFRWPLAADGPAALFPDETAAVRRVGSGEFRGMEFLEVNARSIINAVPAASRMPFRHTVNVYRGCTHACTYCVSGDTPILMGDRTTRPMADVRPGDAVCGTLPSTPARRLVVTTVVNHWAVTAPACRTSLEDGTQFVTSGGHRFLAEGGWRYVAPGQQRPASALLAPDDGLVDARSAAEGSALGDTHRRVASVEPMSGPTPLFDMTTGTGDYVANGVVSHNCFARPTHDYLGLGIGEDFERKIVVKVNAVERLRAELRSPKWGGNHIAMGTNTDPYQQAEGKYHLTQGVVRVLGEHRSPFSILTKSTLVLRDLRLLQEAAGRAPVRLDFSIGTLDREVWKLTEPGTPPPDRRIEAVRRLNEAGIPCGVLVAPVLPGLSDGEEQIRAVVEACTDAGAVSVNSVALHLRPGVRQHFFSWLERARPDLLPLYRRRFARRSYQAEEHQDRISHAVRVAVRRSPGAPAPYGHRLDGVTTPTSPPPPGSTAEQLPLL